MACSLGLQSSNLSQYLAHLRCVAIHKNLKQCRFSVKFTSNFI
ncbi:hypothetical protein HFN_1570 [Helicobacter fennelliae MRY12-0050]|uniref:Uncharacterized protein n=1 Tax=Helicobacter fennelliae MRY12-0050 TaxID=1325130 RepID=T1CYJ1_9HELI|nr:hypothetical protein HFN_1570 [Helicobacter fennelliae MRY12-0050]